MIRYKIADGETMDAVKEAAMCESRRESYFQDFILDRPAYAFEASDGFIAKIRKSSGLRFILLASFHDARLVSIERDTVYGRDALELIIDFRDAEVNSFRKNFHKFRLLLFGVTSGLGFVDERRRFDYCSVLSVIFREKGDALGMRMETYAAYGRGREHEEYFDITFADADVALLA